MYVSVITMIKVLKKAISSAPTIRINQAHTQIDVRYLSAVYCCTIATYISVLEVKVTYIEIMLNLLKILRFLYHLNLLIKLFIHGLMLDTSRKIYAVSLLHILQGLHSTRPCKYNLP